ncbi:LysR family transcriptional regulator [Pseudazoarcus pumilus]|uniref:LysR family transcriptional regulator n=1 Tax=Pseudazoarcus pumilus TaxID=2067960 RepID=A0A2I6S371_9RHOO|nr:LysR family transcriptional regulator [Pseudazoarcus pumilus]AUN93711.1 LysR family transcriptional regulator [Pseudazoarcus pumilus]
MDIELARTFLAIVHGGSFVAASQRLHLTQTAVTARVKNLETQLGCSLFVRNRAGARLTVEGERFVDHAHKMVHAWEAARREVPNPPRHPDCLFLGSEISLSNPLLLQWVRLLRTTFTQRRVHVEVGDSSVLQQKLLRGDLDAALVYRPFYCEGVQVEQLLEEKLIQVESAAQREPYIYVDWGPDFRREHDAAFPSRREHALSFNLGPLALHYLFQCGGRGYFRTRVTRRALRQGTIRIVPNAPEFTYPVFLVYSRARITDELEQAFPLLRRIVRDESDWAEHWEFSP